METCAEEFNIKEKMKLQTVKTDCQLFSRLYVGCKRRDDDIDKVSQEKSRLPSFAIRLRENQVRYQKLPDKLYGDTS